jgi:hypothetical protein
VPTLDDERFEAYLKQFRPCLPEPLPAVEPPQRARRMLQGSQPLTMRSTNALKAKAPSLKTMVDDMACSLPGLIWKSGRCSGYVRFDSFKSSKRPGTHTITACRDLRSQVDKESSLWQNRACQSPKSNWLGTQLTHGRWSAHLYHSKSSDPSAGRAGQFKASSKI